MQDTVEQGENQTIYINMLGEFRLTVGARVISEAMGRTRQLWNLLEYLIANRNKAISTDELIGALWPDGDCENPANALKNLVYRIRTLLQKNGFPYSREMITFSHGSYCFNNSLPCAVDSEEFERLYRLAGAEGMAPEQRIDQYMEAMALYKGDFLPGSSYEEWVVPLAGYYRTLYFKCVYGAVQPLMDMRHYDEAQTVCEKAIVIDPFEERAHILLMRALMCQGKQSAALEHYEHVKELFYRELGVKPSEAMRGLYKELVKSVNQVETDLSVIKEELTEQEADSAFYCDYEVFKNIYRMQARCMPRTGQSVFVGLLTASTLSGGVPEPKRLARVMDLLQSAARRSLRKGDTVSRFSPSQLVLILPTLTYENGLMVLERVRRRFLAVYRAGDVRLHISLQPVDPIL